MTPFDAWTPPAPDLPLREAAQCWFLRMQGGSATAAEIAALREWLAADPEHHQAFANACAAWEQLHSARELMANLYSTKPRRADTARTTIPAKPRWLAAAAAAILIAILTGLTYSRGDIATAEGEVRKLTLPDGTTAWLDTASALDLHYTAAERRIELLRGQAWFDVKADRSRPFIVEALDSRTTDIGTFFGVRRTGRDIAVGVERGTVRVAWRRHDLTLMAGQSAKFGDGTEAMPVAPFDAANIGWQSNRLLFSGERLRNVLREMDRYWPGRIVLIGSEAGDRPVSASLSISDLNVGLDALAATQGVRVTRLTRYLVIVTDAAANAPTGG